jgi:hypothetical protein
MCYGGEQGACLRLTLMKVASSGSSGKDKALPPPPQKISTFLGPNGTRFARGHFRAHPSKAIQVDAAHIKIIWSRPI